MFRHAGAATSAAAIGQPAAATVAAAAAAGFMDSCSGPKVNPKTLKVVDAWPRASRAHQQVNEAVQPRLEAGQKVRLHHVNARHLRPSRTAFRALGPRWPRRKPGPSEGPSSGVELDGRETDRRSPALRFAACAAWSSCWGAGPVHAPSDRKTDQAIGTIDRGSDQKYRRTGNSHCTGADPVLSLVSAL